MIGGIEASSTAYEAVVRVGHCSGVLVSEVVVLTSAHCVDEPIERVVVGGEVLAVDWCRKHPAYDPSRPDHDLAVCRLATRAHVPPMGLAGNEALVSSQRVTMIGFGQTAVLAHGPTDRRAVSTTVVRVRGDVLELGDAEHTACRGDSGGPVLVTHDRGPGRVVGLVQGPVEEICRSSTQAALVDPLFARMVQAQTNTTFPIGSALASALGVVAAAALAKWAHGSSPPRRSVDIGHHDVRSVGA